MPAPAKKYRNVLALAKIETIYQTDAAPTAAANAVLFRNLTVTPLEQEMESLDYIRPYFGASKEISVAEVSSIEFELALAGSGTAGTAPAWGPCVRACGLSETITPGSKVVYRPITNSMEALTLYAYLDGILHKIIGARGEMSFSLTAKKVPVLKFKFMGLFAPATDTPTPTGADFTKFIDPLPICTAYTPVTSLHGVADLAVESFEFSLGNKLEHQVLVRAEDIEITDREPSGTLVFRMPALAGKNWFDAAKTSTTGAVQIKHGITAGNIIQLDAPVVQLKAPTYKDSQGNLMLSASMKLLPQAGNDEFTLTVQ